MTERRILEEPQIRAWSKPTALALASEDAR